MIQSSFPFLFSSSSSYRRLVTLITILLLNPLPIIHGAPTPKNSNHDLTAVQRHKRQVLSDDDGINSFPVDEYLSEPTSEVVFEGLLGMKKIHSLGIKQDSKLFLF